MKNKTFELFFGTGGVGKTTISCARAIALCQQGQRVLLMTIDPAKRLKEVLGLNDQSSGEIIKLSSLPGFSPWSGSLDVLLMDPEKTIQKMSKSSLGSFDLAKNRIVKVLTKPNGGMNEILSLVELEEHFQSGNYDCVVLDTPPGAHFLDFLGSIDKMRKFFDSTFVEIFTSLGKKNTSNEKSSLFSKMVGTGVKKLLDQLEKVAGEKFVQDFLSALEVIYQSQAAFKKGLEIEKRLMDSSLSHWYLVTSTEQGKVKEALEMIRGATKKLNQKLDLVLNKSLSLLIEEWDPKDLRSLELKKSLLTREQNLLSFSKNYFEKSLSFPDVVSPSPLEHIKELSKHWNQYV